MIEALFVIVGILLALIFFRHREAQAIAFQATEFLQERLRAADLERDRLLTRIQQFEPPRPEPPPPPKSQAEVVQETFAPKEYTESDLDERGLISNGDGRLVEAERPENMWESLAEFDGWVAFRRSKGLPADADPRDWQGRMDGE